MSPTFEKLNSKRDSAPNPVVCLTPPEAMETIIVHDMPIVDVQIAAIIRSNRPPVSGSGPHLQRACPTHSKVLIRRETTPIAACVSVDHLGNDPHQGWDAVQVRNISQIAEVVMDLLFETKYGRGPQRASTGIAEAVSSIRSTIPEQAASTATILKELNSQPMLPGDCIPVGALVAHAVQAVIVDSVLVVEPHLAAIIGSQREMVPACFLDDQNA